MRRIALIASLIAACGAVAASVAGADDSHTYKLEMYNAFGIVDGSEVRVAGVTAGTVEELAINEKKRALVTVELSGPLAVLGEDTQCSAEPQSLIAEYFIDCEPRGVPLADGETLPKLVAQTVQTDLVNNTLRLPFRQRLQLLINEFGTGLAGNAENLNEALRLGSPALADLHRALRMLAQQADTIRQLNVDSERIVSTLAERSDDVIAFIRNAGDAAEASAERRDDLSTDFDLLDDALAEIEPTMVELEGLAREQTPLLRDLRGAAPQLSTLADVLPPFAEATERSLVALGRAARPGRQALTRGRDEIRTLAEASRGAPETARQASLFLRDIADPRRIVEIDDRAARTCADKTRSCYSTGRPAPTGYTGMEGLLNYLYYQGGALNQFDEVGHMLHFSLYDVFAGHCGAYNAAQDWPAEGGGRTTDYLEAEDCVGALGPNQPGINESEESICAQAPPSQPCSPRYDSSVCPEGSNEPEICDPNISIRSARGGERRSDGSAASPGPTGEPRPAASGDDAEGAAGLLPPIDLPGGARELEQQLRDLLDLPLNPLGDGLGGRGGKGNGPLGGLGGSGGGSATQDLLDFLFGP